MCPCSRRPIPWPQRVASFAGSDICPRGNTPAMGVRVCRDGQGDVAAAGRALRRHRRAVDADAGHIAPRQSAVGPIQHVGGIDSRIARRPRALPDQRRQGAAAGGRESARCPGSAVHRHRRAAGRAIVRRKPRLPGRHQARFRRGGRVGGHRSRPRATRAAVLPVHGGGNTRNRGIRKDAGSDPGPHFGKHRGPVDGRLARRHARRDSSARS